MLYLSSRPDLCCSNSRVPTLRGHLLSHTTRSTCCNVVLQPRQCCSSSPARNGTSTSISTISSSRRAVVCHDGRPMWARGTPEPDYGNSGGGMSQAAITKEISKCNSVPELETVFIDHSGSFNHINAAAAITKYVKLRGSSMRSPFFSKLAAVWLQQLPEADSQGLANVLWACGKLGSAEHPVWSSTWQALLQAVEKDVGGEQPPSLKPQTVSNVLYACAKLRQQPQPDELLLLLEAFLLPDVLSAAEPQHVANVTWSLGLLKNTPGWEAMVSKELLQRLLAPQQLATVVTEGTDQNVTNVLLGLGRMCTGSSPLLSTAAAQEYAGKLLSGVPVQRLSKWLPQNITNAMWALGELQLKDDNGLIQAAIAASSNWVPRCNDTELRQAAGACAQLQLRDEHFIRLLLKRAEQMLQPNWRIRGRALIDLDKASAAAMCCLSVVLLDMRGLAGLARKLVADSNIKQHSRTHPSSLRRLWVFHSWLLEQQLLDGKGLAGLVTEQQLQQGAKEAAEWGDKTRL